MPNVANLKAKLILETDQYMAAASRVISENKKVENSFEKMADKAARSFSKAFVNAGVKMLGVQAADTMIRSIGENLKDGNKFDLLGSTTVYGIADGIVKGLKSLPIVGAVTELIEDTFFGGMEDKAREAAAKAGAAAAQALSQVRSQIATTNARSSILAAPEYDRDRMERSLQIDQAASAAYLALQKAGVNAESALGIVNELRAAQAQLFKAQDVAAFEKMMQELGNERLRIEGKTTELYLNQLYALRNAGKINQQQFDSLLKTWETNQAIKSTLEEQNEARKKATELEQDRARAAADAAAYMEGLEDTLRRQTMTERQLFEFDLAKRNLKADQVARAREIFALTHAAAPARPTAASAVTGINTAMGSLRVAGSVDYTQARMSSSVDSIKEGVNRISMSTQQIAQAARAA